MGGDIEKLTFTPRKSQDLHSDRDSNWSVVCWWREAGSYCDYGGACESREDPIPTRLRRGTNLHN